MSAEVPDDFSYKWESVGGEHLCAFCPPRIHNHAWRAHSEKYGDAYVCPCHLHHIQTGFRGERHAIWLAIRASKMKSNREKWELLNG